MPIVRVSKTTTLPAPADEVWAFVSDFAGYASWQPHIASIEMQPNGDRKVTFTRGDSILDRVEMKDEATKSLTYGLVPGQPTPMTKLEATFVVTGDGEASEVAYAIEIDVPEQMQEMARGGVGADIDGALAGLTSRFHG
jgi:carbon monoxide dehydrogenase subunit G